MALETSTSRRVCYLQLSCKLGARPATEADRESEAAQCNSAIIPFYLSPVYPSSIPFLSLLLLPIPLRRLAMPALPPRFLLPALAFALLALSAFAQDSTPTPTPSLSLSLTTSSTTVTTTIHSGNRNIPTTTIVPTVFNVTVTLSQSASKTSDVAASQSSSPPDFTILDTHVDPGFGVLGAILILTGLPSAFLGHKNRWTSFFLIGFYTLSLVCFVLILRFGVVPAINPPNKTIRGLFVLSSGVAGIAGGGIAIFFWKAAKYFIGAWGGFALALWIQCFHTGGLIKPLGFRWIMYIGTQHRFWRVASPG